MSQFKQTLEKLSLSSSLRQAELELDFTELAEPQAQVRAHKLSLASSASTWLKYATNCTVMYSANVQCITTKEMKQL